MGGWEAHLWEVGGKKESRWKMKGWRNESVFHYVNMNTLIINWSPISEKELEFDLY